jgi:hypothetical protein
MRGDALAVESRVGWWLECLRECLRVLLMLSAIIIASFSVRTTTTREGAL